MDEILDENPEETKDEPVEEAKDPQQRPSDKKRMNIFMQKNERKSDQKSGEQKFLKKSLDEYLNAENKEVKDFRSSLGPGEMRVFDEREENLELKCLEIISKHYEIGQEKLGWELVERLWDEFLSKDHEDEDKDSKAATLNGYYYLGLAQYELKLFKNAIINLSNALIFDPQNAEIHYYLGMWYLKSGKYDKCSGSFQMVLKLDKTHIYTYNNLSYVYNICGHYQKTIDLWEEGIKLINQNHPAYYMYKGRHIKLQFL